MDSGFPPLQNTETSAISLKDTSSPAIKRAHLLISCDIQQSSGLHGSWFQCILRLYETAAGMEHSQLALRPMREKRVHLVTFFDVRAIVVGSPRPQKKTVPSSKCDMRDIVLQGLRPSCQQAALLHSRAHTVSQEAMVPSS